MSIKGYLEEHQVTGEKLLATVRELIRQGNVRRVIIKNQDGMILMEVPLTISVLGAVLLPVWVALGAIAAVAARYRIVVERVPAAAELGRPAAPELVSAGDNGEGEIC
jgi:hypothetical protein